MGLLSSRRQAKTPPSSPARKPVGQILSKIPGGKFLWSGMFLMSLGLGWWLLFGDKGLYHLYSLRQERDRLLQENMVLRDELERMVKRIDRLRHDHEFIEDTIRRELHFIKKNELIFQLQPEVGSGPQVTQAPPLAPPPPPAAKAKKTRQPRPDGQ